MFDGLCLDIRPRTWRCWRRQQLAAEEERGTPVRNPKWRILTKSGGQDVKQEPADELDRVERQELLLVPVGRVSPAEGHLAILHLDQAAIGDGHPVRKASQILEGMLGAAKGCFGIDHQSSRLSCRKSRSKVAGFWQAVSGPQAGVCICDTCG